MLNDALTNFIGPYGPAVSFVGALNAGFASNVIDILGTGVGTAPQNIIGKRTTFGQDSGIGGNKPQVEAVVGTAGATASGATLNVQFQAAVDTGAGGNYQPGTWTTLVETGPIAVGNLTASQILARFDYPPAFPANLSPRYLRLNFQTATGTFTAGTISSAIVTMVRDDSANRFATNNYTVA